MKRNFLLIVLGVALTGSAWAQSTDSTNTPPPGGQPSDQHPHGGFLSGILTPDEQKEFLAAHDAALKANPDLATEEKDLAEKMKAAFDSGEPPDANLLALRDDFHKKMHDAMLQADPNIAPILAKLDAARKKHHGWSGGPPPPPPQGQESPSSPTPTNSAPAGN